MIATDMDGPAGGDPLARHTGGCQCGAVRFALAGEPDPATICHCRMCQKAFGGYFAPLATVRRADLTWTRGAPHAFDSSDEVTRGFCANCGTPLTFAYKGADHIDIALGAFDQPERIPVVAQLWASARVPSFDRLAALPARPEDEPGFEDTITRIAATNHQHPDHDVDEWKPRPSRPDGA